MINKKWGYLIGIGLALFPIHNAWLTDHTAINGEATLFLPALASIPLILGVLFYIQRYYKEAWASKGDKKIYIPLLVIAGAIAISGIGKEGIVDKVAPAGMALTLFCLYLFIRNTKLNETFMPIAIGASITAIGVIIYAAIHLGEITGGYIFERNYDGVVGYVLLGVALYESKYQIWLLSLAIIAMFLTGSPEAVFVTGVAVLAVIVRKDWGKRLLIVVVPSLIVVIVWFAAGWGQQLYSYTFDILNRAKTNPMTQSYVPDNSGIVYDPTFMPWAGDEQIDGGIIKRNAIGYRIEIIKYALKNVRPLGTGYILTDFTWETVHNVPIVIVEQLGYPGIIAALAWVWVSFYCLWKTKRYIWVLAISMMVFDHFMWTHLSPLWWCIVGISTVREGNDYLFRNNNNGIMDYRHAWND